MITITMLRISVREMQPNRRYAGVIEIPESKKFAFEIELNMDELLARAAATLDHLPLLLQNMVVRAVIEEIPHVLRIMWEDGTPLPKDFSEEDNAFFFNPVLTAICFFIARRESTPDLAEGSFSVPLHADTFPGAMEFSSSEELQAYVAAQNP